MAVNSGLKPYQLLIAKDDVFTDDTLLSAAYSGYLADVQAERPYTCPKCGGTGRHAASVDTGNGDDTDLIECTMVDSTGTIACNGYGYTTQPIKVVATNISYQIIT